MRVRLLLVQALVFSATVLGWPGARPAWAQRVPLANLLPELILREITLQSPPAPPGTPGVPEGFTHLAHFSPLEANEPANPVVGVVHGFNTQMATQFATFPLGSSTGGLTYVFDPTVGTFQRGSASFGPLFAERALTIGRRRLSAGVNYQRTSYDTFEGRNLDDGSIKFYLRHQDCCTVVLTPGIPPGFNLTEWPNGTRLNPPFEGDIIEADLLLDATTHTTALFANYGVTDRWDIGLAVPVVRVTLDATVRARMIRLVTAGFTVHAFDAANPDAELVLRRNGQATGLGDIIVRSKYRFLRAGSGGLAAAVDLRLPTGDETELLGAGGAQAKFLLIASSERGRLGSHVNVGYTVAQGRSAGAFAGLTSAPLPDEVNYSGGVEFIASRRLTVMGDVVGRTLRGAGRLEIASKSFEYNEPTVFLTGMPGPGCSGIGGFTCRGVSFDEFDPRPGNLNLVLGAAGVKINPAGNWLISGSVLFPLTDAGLRSRLTTVVGVDYAF
jgi:hypothetical protein